MTRLLCQFTFTLILFVLFIVLFGYPAIEKFIHEEVFIKLSTEPKVINIFFSLLTQCLSQNDIYYRLNSASGQNEDSEHCTAGSHPMRLRCVQPDITGNTHVFYLWWSQETRRIVHVVSAFLVKQPTVNHFILIMN